MPLYSQPGSAPLLACITRVAGSTAVAVEQSNSRSFCYRAMPPRWACLFAYLVNLSGSTRGGSIAPYFFSSNSRRDFKKPVPPPLDPPRPCLTSSREAGPQRVPPRWTAQAAQFLPQVWDSSPALTNPFQKSKLHRFPCRRRPRPLDLPASNRTPPWPPRPPCLLRRTPLKTMNTTKARRRYYWVR